MVSQTAGFAIFRYFPIWERILSLNASQEFRPTFTLFLQTKHKPKANAYDSALWQRIRLMPMNLSSVDDPKADHESQYALSFANDVTILTNPRMRRGEACPRKVESGACPRTILSGITRPLGRHTGLLPPLLRGIQGGECRGEPTCSPIRH